MAYVALRSSHRAHQGIGEVVRRRLDNAEIVEGTAMAGTAGAGTHGIAGVVVCFVRYPGRCRMAAVAYHSGRHMVRDNAGLGVDAGVAAIMARGTGTRRYAGVSVRRQQW